MFRLLYIDEVQDDPEHDPPILVSRVGITHVYHHT